MLFYVNRNYDYIVDSRLIYKLRFIERNKKSPDRKSVGVTFGCVSTFYNFNSVNSKGHTVVYGSVAL